MIAGLEREKLAGGKNLDCISGLELLRMAAMAGLGGRTGEMCL